MGDLMRNEKMSTLEAEGEGSRPSKVGVFVKLMLEGLGGAGEGVGIRDAALCIWDRRLAAVGNLNVLQSHIVCEKTHWLIASFHRHTVDLRGERLFT